MPTTVQFVLLTGCTEADMIAAQFVIQIELSPLTSCRHST
jgi:hypothetical protein